MRLDVIESQIKKQHSDNLNPYFISTGTGDRSKKEIMCYDKDDAEYSDIRTKYEDTVSTSLDSSSFRVLKVIIFNHIRKAEKEMVIEKINRNY